MNAQRYTVHTPGKLFIAGEYAITEPAQVAIVAAIDRCLTVDIQTSRLNRIDLPELGLTDITWRFDSDKLVLSKSDQRLNYLKAVLETVYRYKGEDTPSHIYVTSELDAEEGKKYGLGSSAALTVGLTSALLQCGHKETPAKEIVFKLAAIAHYSAQGNGSCADIAASVYGGYLRYQSFDFSFLQESLEKNMSIRELVEQPWPYLEIEALTLPKSLRFVVGWTKEEAHTKHLVEAVHSYRETHPDGYRSFIDRSRKAVESIVQAFKIEDIEKLLLGMRDNRRALNDLTLAAGVPIETKKLSLLINVVEDGIAKSSGAGGGDCGIAFLRQHADIKKLREVWASHDIDMLDLDVSADGVLID